MNKNFISFISNRENFAWVNSAPTPAERERRKLELQKRFDNQSNQSNFSSVATFNNPDIEDSNGFDFWNDELNSYPEYDGVMKVRAVVERERARLDAVAYCASRNATAKANREKRTKNLSN